MPSHLCAASIQEVVFLLIGMLKKLLVPTNCYQLQFQWGCFEDSAWSFNRLEDWTALFTFMNLLLCMVIFSLIRSRVQGDSCPTALARMAGQSTSYGSFMPASNTPTCDFKILMTLRTCCTPSDLSYHVYVVLFCVILLTLTLTATRNSNAEHVNSRVIP